MATKIVQTGIRMPEHLKQQLIKIAEYHGKTLNSIMLDALESYVASVNNTSTNRKER